MIIFFANNIQIPFNQVWYHYQDLPKPGGYKYLIKIPLEEKKIIEIFETLICKKIIDPVFCSEALMKKDNHFNLISWVTDYLSEKYPEKKFNIKWIFNSIDNVEIIDGNIIIKGIASVAL